MKQIPGQLQGQAAGQLYGLKEGEHMGTQDIENIIYAWQVCVYSHTHTQVVAGLCVCIITHTHQWW